MSNLHKSQSMMKSKSKIPMSCPKPESASAANVKQIKTPTKTLSSKSRSTPNTSPAVNKNVEKRHFDTKCAMLKQLYKDTKDEILRRQKTADKIYKEATELRERMLVAGGENVAEINEVIFTLMPIRSKQKKKSDPTMFEKIETLLESVRPKLEEIPDTLSETCKKILGEKVDMTNQLLKLVQDEPEPENLLQTLYTFKSNEDDFLALEKLQATYKFVIAEVVAEMSRFVADVKTIATINDESLSDDVSEKLQLLNDQLLAEKRKNTNLTKEKGLLDNQLRETKSVVEKLEEQMESHENRFQQYKKREASLEQTIKELKSSLERNKEMFETRLREVKKESSLKEREFQDLQKEMEHRIEEVIDQLEGEKINRKVAEDNYTELENKYRLLEEKSENLCTLAYEFKEKKVESTGPSEKEIALFEQLKQEKQLVAHLQDKLIEMQQQNDEYMKVFEKTVTTEDDTSSKLIIEIQNNKILENKYKQLKQELEKKCEEKHAVEKELLELKNVLLTNADGVKDLEITFLKQRTEDLEGDLVKFRIRNEELEKNLNIAQLRLEDKERELKLMLEIKEKRNDIIGVIRPEQLNSNNEQVFRKESYDDVNKQIREYHNSLQEKHAKIESLKKAIKQYSEQVNRFQKTRTNLESRIAVLEAENHCLRSENSRRKLCGIW